MYDAACTYIYLYMLMRRGSNVVRKPPAHSAHPIRPPCHVRRAARSNIGGARHGNARLHQL
eukprot:9045314-Lingulodinium_polyedra.AAC.1